jgi:hypothetical protein
LAAFAGNRHDETFVLCVRFTSLKRGEAGNMSIVASLGFGAHGGGHPAQDEIAPQVRAYDAMARKGGEHRLLIPDERVRREDCLKPCLSIDTGRRPKKVVVDKSTGVMNVLTGDIVLPRRPATSSKRVHRSSRSGRGIGRPRKRSTPTPSSSR